VPAYGEYVDGQVARLGRGHPLIRTQYFNEEIDAQAGMFTPRRRAMMRCEQPHPPHLRNAEDGEGRRAEGAFVFTLDVAGQDEAAFHDPDEQMLRNPGRDAVSLTIAAVDLSELDTLQRPIFRIVGREQWTGLNHLAVFGRLSALADQWRPQYIVIDATGVGEGLWAMLDRRYPTRILPVKFSAQKKSEIGYRFLAMIETGRLRDCSGERASNPHRPLRSHEGTESFGGGGDLHGCPDMQPGGRRAGMNPAPTGTVTEAMVDRQYTACISEVLPGPQHTMRWGVPEGTRDEDGNLIHDDILMADALLAEADALEWRVGSPTLVVEPKDPLEEMSHIRDEAHEVR
jgi:hypothetical protein